jgi:3-oxoacyl-[acyl-carrier protein] reductase
VNSDQLERAKGESRVALVSGASRGLGLGIAKGLLASGHKVAAFSRSASAETDSLMKEFSGQFHFAEADLADEKKVWEFIRLVHDRLGPVTILINNAGVLQEGVLARQSVDVIDRMLNINLRGTILLTRQVVRTMMIRQTGWIINISSIVNISGYKGTVAYSATKGAIDAMTRALARELGGRNIRVNSIAPGYLQTDLTASMSPTQLDQVVRRTPLGRLGRIEDVVGLVLFLISPEASFISGQTIVVDGGLTA